jgi:hypothetical protein
MHDIITPKITIPKRKSQSYYVKTVLNGIPFTAKYKLLNCTRHIEVNITHILYLSGGQCEFRQETGLTELSVSPGKY